MTHTLPTPATFLLDRPLYSDETFEGEQVWGVIDLLYFNGTYDSYCPKCGREATFKASAPERPQEFVRDTALEQRRRSKGMEIIHPQIDRGIHKVHAVCTRSGSHTQDFFFQIDSRLGTSDDQKRLLVHFIQKVGQQPSFGDLHLEHTKRYQGSLPPAQLRELTRAIGLASHDVGIGSYVYLRRVFEWLVEEAHALAQADGSWDEEKYQKSRMGERIGMLKHHLPEFLVEHPEMYGLLSKGVHELSEKECLEHFSTLRIATELILDERLEKQLRTKKIAEAKAALAKASSRNA